MAPSCLVQSSMAANQGRTRSRKLFIVSSMAILLNTPVQRAAMWRTAVYGCCKQVNRWGRCSSSWKQKQTNKQTQYIHTYIHITEFTLTIMFRILKTTIINLCIKVFVWTMFNSKNSFIAGHFLRDHNSDKFFLHFYWSLKTYRIFRFSTTETNLKKS